MKKKELQNKKIILKNKQKNYKIVLTEHARERILERMRCNKDKMEKVALKAWLSKDKVNNGNLLKKLYIYPKCEFKIFSGCLFVFKCDGYDPVDDKYIIILITVINYKDFKK